MMSFPPGTEMFQFPGLALNPLFDSEVSYLLWITEIQDLIGLVPETGRSQNSVIEGGFPHSEIRGSKLLRSSSRLIAA